MDDEVAARGRIGGRYTELFATVPGVVAPQIAKGNTSVYAQYTIRVADRDGLGAKLKERGIPTAQYYPKCLHEQPVYASLGYKWGDFPEAEKASRAVLSLPMSPFLTETDQNAVVEAIKDIIA